MRRFQLDTLTRHLVDLVEDREWCFRLRALDDADRKISKDQWKHIWDRFRELMDLASEAEFRSAFASVNALCATYDADNGPPNISALESDVRHVVDMFLHDLDFSTFLMVPSRQSHFVDNDAIFGDAVYEAFPSARMDLRSAGNCLAADCNTAAVFHLMRAIEWALRALAVHLGFRQMRVQKKSGVIKHVPLSHLEWEKVLDQLQTRVDRRIERMRPGKRKQGMQEFYYPILQEIRAMRDAWRNHVMHTRAEYGAEDALAIKGHVDRLMVKLASRVSESASFGRASLSRVRRFPASSPRTL